APIHLRVCRARQTGKEPPQIAASGPFDLDYVGAEIRHHRRRRRPGHVGAAVDYPYPRECVVAVHTSPLARASSLPNCSFRNRTAPRASVLEQGAIVIRDSSDARHRRCVTDSITCASKLAATAFNPPGGLAPLGPPPPTTADGH